MYGVSVLRNCRDVAIMNKAMLGHNGLREHVAQSLALIFWGAMVEVIFVRYVSAACCYMDSNIDFWWWHKVPDKCIRL